MIIFFLQRQEDIEPWFRTLIGPGPKVSTPGISHFRKNLNFSKIHKTHFFSTWILLLDAGLKKLPKRTISWMMNQYEKLWKVITLQPLILCYMIRYLYESFNLAKDWGVTLGRRGQKQKVSQNETENEDFDFILMNFQTI